MFREGELDVALLPIFEWVRDPSHPIVGSGGICSPGPVDSVLLFSRGPVAEARSVLLDESSLTSAALVRVLYDEHFGGRPEFASCGADLDPRQMDADACLLIGDPALRAPRDRLVLTDLASAWRELTGLPFCFAAWLARDEETAERVRGPLRAARERGLAGREEFAARESASLGLRPQTLLRYLTERITYELGEPERAAAERFAGACRRLGLV
jgi:chorismate dehydratase